MFSSNTLMVNSFSKFPSLGGHAVKEMYLTLFCITKYDCMYGQFHRYGRYIQSHFWNFNLAQAKDRKGLSNFTLMIMFVPTDALIEL